MGPGDWDIGQAWGTYDALPFHHSPWSHFLKLSCLVAVCPPNLQCQEFRRKQCRPESQGPKGRVEMTTVSRKNGSGSPGSRSFKKNCPCYKQWAVRGGRPKYSPAVDRHSELLVGFVGCGGCDSSGNPVPNDGLCGGGRLTQSSSPSRQSFRRYGSFRTTV